MIVIGICHRVETLGGESCDRHELGVSAEHDVGTATGHVRGNGDRAETTRLGDDGGLARVVLGVQHLVTNTTLREQFRQVLALLDGRGAHEHGLTQAVALLNIVGNALELDDFVLEDEVGVVFTHHGAVGGNRHHAQLVCAHELAGLGLGRTGHSRELLVHAEVVLQGHGGQGLVLRLDLDTLLGLDGLVYSLVVAAAGKDAAGVLVDDEDLAVHDDVVFVTLEEGAGLDRVVQERDQGRVRRLIEVVNAEVVLDLLDSGLEHTHGALFLVDLIVGAHDERVGDGGKFCEPSVGLTGSRSRDDQGRTCLINQNRVDLIHNGKVVAALYSVARLPRHIVAQIVEAELVVGSVGDVG